ncbi:hypothetical protein JMK10_19470 [Rhodovulum sulfidophilum]|uniref:hypothetical protein n=1 Tax=Rhodovulum sulfidophilum TaxID=35806 RepID=UPI001922F000|nr:hypothetical protein [Rhodovulum sulfidophilum]MBL3576397.1 hypothetical protein [Rhodovulum sulfidophilum]MCE8433851.1 hypothetical protein [Rhodovulum sulfidophilum]MCF4118902.1 hypothetical protein [Rhodovulum sulfidophilum]
MAPAALPLTFAGPPGWAVLGVVGLGTLLWYGATRERAPAVPRTETDTQTKTCDRPWTVRVHAQGNDCGGTSSSTIGAPPIVKTSAPVTRAEGIALSNATWALLNKRQQAIRVQSKTKLERYINSNPPLGQRSFPASDRSGGKRMDIDNYGCSPNFLA